MSICIRVNVNNPITMPIHHVREYTMKDIKEFVKEHKFTAVCALVAIMVVIDYLIN